MAIDLDNDILFTCHPDPLWIYDLGTLRFLAVNNAAIAKYGYSEKEFLAMTIADIRPQEDMPQLLANVASVTTGLDQAGIWTHRLKSGETIFVDITSHTIDYHGIKAELVSARDVSKLIKSNERLQQQEANLRTTQRLLSLGTWQQNLDTGELTWSDNIYALYGVDPNDFASGQETFRALLHPDDREEMFARIAAYDAAPKPHFNFQHRVLRPDGKIIHVRGVGELTHTKAGRILSGVVRDVTTEMETDAQLASAASIQRIAGRAALLGGWRVDIASETVEWSEETIAIHEITANIPGKYRLPLTEAIGFFAPQYHRELWQLFSDCKTHGNSFDQAFELITAEGNHIWGRVIGEPEYDSNGNICAVQGALQDITAQVVAQKESENLSTRLHQTLDSMSDAFFLLDKDYCFAYLNNRAAQLIQQDKEDLVGHNILSRLGATAMAPFMEQYRIALNNGTSVHFTRYFPPLKTWFNVDVYPSNEGLAVYFRDVTEAKIREEQLRLLETAVSRQNDILLITEADSIDAPDAPKIVYINDAFVRKTGFNREEVLGKTPRILQGKDTQRSELDRIRAALETAQPVRSELINYTKGGEPFWLEVDIVPLMDGSGKPSHFVAVERDISERKASEQAARINEERFQLVARATNDVIWDWDLVNNLVWWNEALDTLFGYAPGDVEPGAESWSNRIHPDDRDRVLASIHRVIDGSDSKWQHEYRFIH
ncbi:MAG: PAS domain-containing protein, partial [Porticoccaceae bacterium]